VGDARGAAAPHEPYLGAGREKLLGAAGPQLRERQLLAPPTAAGQFSTEANAEGAPEVFCLMETEQAAFSKWLLVGLKSARANTC
jgi:hypothetical protein